MRTMIAQDCANCQETYMAAVSELKRGNGRYCSRKCSGEAHRGQRVSHQANTQCSWCGIDFYRRPTAKKSKSGHYYCSKEHQSLGAKNRVHVVGPESDNLRCIDCNKIPFNIKETTTRCRSCQKEYNLAAWLSGDNSVTLNRSRNTGLPVDTKGFVKKYLLDTRGDKCEVCGWDEKAPDGRSIIQMDHINGNCFDNRLENLKLLCPNHHAMTSNYGSLNKGSGRAHRRKNAI